MNTKKQKPHTPKLEEKITAKGTTGTLEKEFLEGFHEGRVAVSVGVKHSGKGYRLMGTVYEMTRIGVSVG